MDICLLQLNSKISVFKYQNSAQLEAKIRELSGIYMSVKYVKTRD